MQEKSRSRTLKELKAAPELLVSFEEFNELIGLGAIKDLEQRFVKKTQR